MHSAPPSVCLFATLSLALGVSIVPSSPDMWLDRHPEGLLYRKGVQSSIRVQRAVDWGVTQQALREGLSFNGM